MIKLSYNIKNGDKTIYQQIQILYQKNVIILFMIEIFNVIESL